MTATSFIANWEPEEEAKGYYLDVSTTNLFLTFVPGYNYLDVGNVTKYTVTGLQSDTTYYYRVRAYDNDHISYTSNIIEAETLLADADGNVYEYVTIGTQQWLTTNLKTTKYNDNSAIPLVTGTAAWAALVTDAYCWYNNDPTTYGDYGILYNWYAVDTGKLAPTGWRVPSKTDMETLETFIGGSVVAGGKLKETGTTYWNAPNTGATDTYGFAVLGAGSRDSLGNYSQIKENASLQTSTAFDANRSYSNSLFYDHADTNILTGWKKSGMSVRCMRDV